MQKWGDEMNLVGTILFILITLAFLLYVKFHKPKTIGTIICQKDSTLVIELKDEESLDKLRTNRQVTFDVHIER